MKQVEILRKYREMEIQTSPPEKLIILLYDEAVKCLKMAITKIKIKDIEQSNRLLLKTQKIIRELMCSLNVDVGEVAMGLYNLYEYIYERLVQANIEKNAQIVEEVLSLIKPLREAWIKAAEVVNEDNN